MIQIAPSILSADFSRLGEELTMLNHSQADCVHIDVMDGHFVPNLTIGPMVLRALRPYTALPFDVHLMLSQPARFVKPFADAGADRITIHLESEDDVADTLGAIRALGCMPGLSLKPGTPVEAVFPYLDAVELVLIMTVEPGFGGQGMLFDCLEKVVQIKKESAARGLSVLTEIDGGVNLETIGRACASGVDIAVAGSAVFEAGDPCGMIEKLKRAAF